jgi:hypothetical protein
MSEIDAKTVEAVGRLTEALETVERARGALYDFHQLTGEADFKIGDAAELLRQAGHEELADELDREIVGRNVIAERWTFQIVEDYDDGYWSAVREAERKVREKLAGGERHLHEAQMKQDRRTQGQPGHGAGPGLEEKSEQVSS